MELMEMVALIDPKPADEGRVKRMNEVKGDAILMAETICRLCPPSAERTLALRALHLAVMHANSAIAVNK